MLVIVCRNGDSINRPALIGIELRHVGEGMLLLTDNLTIPNVMRQVTSGQWLFTLKEFKEQYHKV